MQIINESALIDSWKDYLQEDGYSSQIIDQVLNHSSIPDLVIKCTEAMYDAESTVRNTYLYKLVDSLNV